MGLFKKKSKHGQPSVGEEVCNDSPTRKKFSFSKSKKKQPQQQPQQQRQPQAAASTGTKANTKAGTNNPIEKQQLQQQVVQQRAEEDEEELGDIPRSISTPSRDDTRSLPPLPHSGNDGATKESESKGGNKEEEEEEEDHDSIGSPCESMRKVQERRQREQAELDSAVKRAAIVARLQDVTQQAPSLDHLGHYVAALSSAVSPDPSSELPSRALRCLFSLSEHSGHKQQRIDMVRRRIVPCDDEKESAGKVDGDDEVANASLVPALLSFLKRTPRDSSEQYLTLLVLNNLSIPAQNKRPIALEHGAAKTLGRLLCEDPGCHLLVIIVVNLTFGDEALNRDLLTMSLGGNGRRRVRSSGSGEKIEKEKSFVSCGGDVQLVDSLAYALLLASLTTEQLSTLGPIPLTSAEGIHHAPRKLLSLLFSLLEGKLGIRYRKNASIGPAADEAMGGADGELCSTPLTLGGDDCPFPETARWCLGALKNLTRPGRLSPSVIGRGKTSKSDAPAENELGFLADSDGSAVAAQAVLDAGILPLLLRILKCNRNDAAASSVGDGGALYDWQPNSAQDAALYTLMHMASVPQARGALKEDCNGHVLEALTSVLTYGKAIGDRLSKFAIGHRAQGDEDADLGYTSLQCLKARLALSYLLLDSENSNSNRGKYAAATVLAEHETYALVELLSNCLQGRAKEGPGGYSAATFALKGVLFGIRCILSEPENRELFASSAGNGARLNALLLKAVARHSLLDVTAEVMDAEAAEHALVSMYKMSLYCLDEQEIGFESPFGSSVFLQATYGYHGKTRAKSVVAKVLDSYLNKSTSTLRGRHAASQILFRKNFLRFEGSVADLSKPGNMLPSESDLDLDGKVLDALKTLTVDESLSKGAKPKQYIFDRAVARREKGTVGTSKVFSNALLAAEELARTNAASHQGPSLDTILVANNITYYADGVDVYMGHTWKWNDGRGDLIERIYSAAETEDELLAPDTANDETERSEPYSPPRKGFLGRLKVPIHGMSDDNEPFSIFGLRCAAPMCGGKRSVM